MKTLHVQVELGKHCCKALQTINLHCTNWMFFVAHCYVASWLVRFCSVLSPTYRRCSRRPSQRTFLILFTRTGNQFFVAYWLAACNTVTTNAFSATGCNTYTAQIINANVSVLVELCIEDWFKYALFN